VDVDAVATFRTLADFFEGGRTPTSTVLNVRAEFDFVPRVVALSCITRFRGIRLLRET